jgi:hypothetical protein
VSTAGAGGGKQSLIHEIIFDRGFWDEKYFLQQHSHTRCEYVCSSLSDNGKVYPLTHTHNTRKFDVVAAIFNFLKTLMN